MRLTVALLALVAAACSTPLSHQQELQRAPDDLADASSESLDEACEPGASKSCFCAIGEPEGVRVCRDDGTAWQACSCLGRDHDAGTGPNDAGALQDATIDASDAVDAGPDASLPGPFWALCETNDDCPSPLGGPRFWCMELGALGKHCTFGCPECALLDVPCGFDPCDERGGYCDAVVSGSPALWCVTDE